MKTARLLHTLEQQFADLRQRALPLAGHAALSARFDLKLFRTRSTRLRDCLAEVEDNLAALRQAVEHKQLPQVIWLAERISNQMAAINQETLSWSLRAWDNPSPAVARWQRKRLQHQEFERRLMEMKAEREQRLTSVTGFDEQQQLLREVDIYAERLARCRQALSAIDARLMRLTR